MEVDLILEVGRVLGYEIPWPFDCAKRRVLKHAKDGKEDMNVPGIVDNIRQSLVLGSGFDPQSRLPKGFK